MLFPLKNRDKQIVPFLRKQEENKMNSHSDHTLHFEAVNSRNRAEVEHLEVFADQSGFIESVTQCLQEADKLELWRPSAFMTSVC